MRIITSSTFEMYSTDQKPEEQVNQDATEEETYSFNFKALAKPKDIPRMIEELKEMPDSKKTSHKIQAQSDSSFLFHRSKWEELSKRYIEIIIKNLPSAAKSSLSPAQRIVLQAERTLVNEWVKKHKQSSQWSESFKNDNRGASCHLRLNAYAFLRLVRKEMCHGVNTDRNTLESIIDQKFTMESNSLNDKFAAKRLGESLYYIAGWLVHAVKKASKRRHDELKRVMEILSVNAVESDKKNLDSFLPVAKVKRIEKYDGLSYPTRNFFEFVIRLELVFKTVLKVENIALFGSSIIHNLFKALETNDKVRSEIIALVPDEEVSDCTALELVTCIVRPYCRMRGKDFVRKFMSQRGQVNLEKGTRAKLAIKSEGKKKKQTKKKQTKQADNVSKKDDSVDVSDRDKEKEDEEIITDRELLQVFESISNEVARDSDDRDDDDIIT